MSSYPVRRGNAHLGLFTQAEVIALLTSGKLLGTDEAMVSPGKWVLVSAQEFRLVASTGVSTKVPLPAVASAPSVSSVPALPVATGKATPVLLRTLLACAVACAVMSVVLDQSLEHVLPSQLREWRELDQGFFESWLFLIPCLISLACWFVGVGGAWFCKKWGANIMLCSTVVISVLNALTPSVTPGAAGFFADTGLLLEGAALGLMFFGDVLE
jgi:hypothetical protein